MKRPGPAGLRGLFLGDNPFIGVDHFARARARERLSDFAPERMLTVLDAALAAGAAGYVFTTHPRNLQLLEVIRQGAYQRPLVLCPLVPDVQAYVQRATEKGLLGLALEKVRESTWADRMNLLITVGASLLTIDPFEGFKAMLDLELRPLLASIPRSAEVRAIFLHETVVDLALAYHVGALFEAFVDHVSRRYAAIPGFVTRNLPIFVARAREMDVPLGRIAVMTPLNRAGFQMNPSRQACEETLGRVPELAIVAMSVLAAGYLTLQDAVEYLGQLPGITAVVVGASTPEHAQESISRLTTIVA